MRGPGLQSGFVSGMERGRRRGEEPGHSSGSGSGLSAGLGAGRCDRMRLARLGCSGQPQCPPSWPGHTELSNQRDTGRDTGLSPGDRAGILGDSVMSDHLGCKNKIAGQSHQKRHPISGHANVAINISFNFQIQIFVSKFMNYGTECRSCVIKLLV